MYSTVVVQFFETKYNLKFQNKNDKFIVYVSPIVKDSIRPMQVTHCSLD
jgi:hypothetical protein